MGKLLIIRNCMISLLTLIASGLDISRKLQDLAREKGAGNAHDGSKWGVGK